MGAESLRRWMIQAEIDVGRREGRTSEEHAEFKRLKAENRQQSRATAGWVDWYNYRRLHGSLGMTSADEFDATCYAAVNPEPLPA